jgi:hypothetical protein
MSKTRSVYFAGFWVKNKETRRVLKIRRVSIKIDFNYFSKRASIAVT